MSVITPELIEYIKSEIKRGIPKEEIKRDLISRGWDPKDIDFVINHLKNSNQRREEKNNLKTWTAISLIFIVIGSAFLVYHFWFSKPIPQVKNSSNEIDCGINGFDCFINAAKECKKSKMVLSHPVEIMGMIQDTTDLLEIRGMDKGKCVLFVKVENATAHFSNKTIEEALSKGLTMKEIKEQEKESNEYLKYTIGKYTLCRFNSTKDLVNMLGNWSQGDFMSNTNITIGEEEEYNTVIWPGATCEGPLFSGNASLS